MQRYCEELNNTEAWQRLVEQAEQGHVTLLYSAKNTEHNQATVLKKYIEEKIQNTKVC